MSFPVRKRDEYPALRGVSEARVAEMIENSEGGGGGAVWGGITGTLSTQTDLQNALNNKSDYWHGHSAFDILPYGDVAGTVLKTDGDGNVYWAEDETGGGGGGGANNTHLISLPRLASGQDYWTFTFVAPANGSVDATFMTYSAIDGAGGSSCTLTVFSVEEGNDTYKQSESFIANSGAPIPAVSQSVFEPFNVDEGDMVGIYVYPNLFTFVGGSVIFTFTPD